MQNAHWIRDVIEGTLLRAGDRNTSKIELGILVKRVFMEGAKAADPEASMYTDEENHYKYEELWEQWTEQEFGKDRF